MISLTIWICLWSSFFVLAPPSFNINHHHQSLENLPSHITSNTTSKMLIKRRKTKVNRTKHVNFDLKSYRSSWKFVDKDTVRVRFRVSETILHSIISTRFLVRHIHTDHIQTYNEPHEIINSTLSLYLNNLKHGRHTVCLLISTLKQMKNTKYIFCQDIIFNFHKYGQHDMDSEEYKNTFFFLLTQYAIVIGMLCTLQLIHIIRKRRLLGSVYDKANSLRNLMMEYHHRSQENKSSPDLNNQSHALECLIYNLNRKSLYNFDQMYMRTTNDDDTNSTPISIHHQRKGYEKHLKLPNRLNEYLTTPLLRQNRSVSDCVDGKEESDFDTRSDEEQLTSFKSVSHILEANKPWMTRLTDDGSIKHSILSSEHL
jgi:hypothetical protein